MKIKILAIAAAIVVAPLAAQASLLTFDSGRPYEISNSTYMSWSNQGGGHMYMTNYGRDGTLIFRAPVTLNSFQLNRLPWVSYSEISTTDWWVTVAALDSSNQSLWSTTLNLESYDQWGEWLTVGVNVSNVRRLTVYATGSSAMHDIGFFPSLDNMYINEAWVAGSDPNPGANPGPGTGSGGGGNGVPEPSTLALLAVAGVGLIRRRRCA